MQYHVMSHMILTEKCKPNKRTWRFELLQSMGLPWLLTSKVRLVYISNLEKYSQDEGMEPRHVSAKDKRQFVKEAVLNYERACRHGKA